MANVGSVSLVSMATGDCLCVNTLCDVWKQIDDYQLRQKVKFVRQSATQSFGSDGKW